MAFHRQRGVTLEVNAEAYRFLRTCIHPCPLPPPDHPAACLVSQLAHLGFLTPADLDDPGRAEPGREKAPAVVSIPWPGDGLTLSAPETVHLAITARCNLACPGCYVPPFIGAELTTAELRNLIDQWARMRVFQLAVGGGEPLLHQDMFDVLAYAREQGIVPNLTTNGTLLTSDTVRRLERAGVARVNLSWCDVLSESKGGPGGREQGRAAVRALRLLLDSTLRVGINLLVTRALLPCLPQTLGRLQVLGVRRVTILRPKPPVIPSQVGAAWYAANRLCRTDLLRLRDVLNGWQGVLHLEVDSALVGLMGDTDAAALRWRGVHGCTAGRRICTVWPDGRVSPCSFLVDVSAGSVHQTPFPELWRRGKGWEALRDTTAQPQGGCAGCEAAVQCGGARCVARYERGAPLAGDGECPHCREEAGCAS